MSRQILIIFAKAPIPGKVKTRFIPHLSSQQATELYQCLLLDTFDLVDKLNGVEKHIAYTPSDARNYFQSLESKGFHIFPQSEGDLGKRLLSATELFFEQEKDCRIVIIGTDSPTLPIGYLRHAFEHLKENDVVIGPSRDGGYYLIGLSNPCPGLFSDIDWSTEKVFSQTEEKLQLLRKKYLLLPCWYDVDTMDDLKYLKAEWEPLSRENHQEVAQKTREFIEKIECILKKETTPLPPPRK